VDLRAWLRPCSVGPATADAARAAGLAVHGVPARHDAEGVLEAPEPPPRGKRFLIPRSSLAGTRCRTVCVARVRSGRARGHRTEPAAVDAPALRAELASGAFTALTFTSPRRCVARGAARRAVARSRPALRGGGIGPVTAEALAAEGLPADVVATAPHARALVEALAARLAGRDGAR
jgi:uroporphyrinogen-III synthase